MNKLLLGTLAMAGIAAALLIEPLTARAAPINGAHLSNGTVATNGPSAASRASPAGLSLTGVVLPG